MGDIKFGTSGWRAIIAEDFTYDNVGVCAQAVAGHLKKKKTAKRGVVIGYDTRFLSEKFAERVALVLAGNNIRCWLSPSPVPTPVLAFEVLRRHAGGAVNITASHNPSEYNGFKFNSEWGGPALPEETRALEQLCLKIKKHGTVKMADPQQARHKGLIQKLEPKEIYFKRLKQMVDCSAIKKARLRIVVDPLWGAGIGYLDTFLKNIGCEIKTIHTNRDVLFGGKHPEPAMEQLQAVIKEMKPFRASLGLSTDGDADRFGVVDADPKAFGAFFTPNQVIGLLLNHLLKTRGWQGPAVRSLATTHWIDAIAAKRGVEVMETPVGFKFVGEAMLKYKGTIGGEESGGLTIHDYIPEKDGILACLLMAEMVAVNKKSITRIYEELCAEVGRVFSGRINLKLKPGVKEKVINLLQKKPPREFAGIPVARVNASDGFKFYLQDKSWVMVRFSGTEPLVRIYWESWDKKTYTSLQKSVEKLLRSV